MIDSLYIAESGMNSQQKLIEMISNNIANTNTAGFKSSSINFVDLVYQTHNTEQSGALVQGAGVGVASTQTDFSVGDLKQTGNPFDVAINGNGFLAVETQNGDIAYTRAGRLRLDSQGFLTSSEGLKLAQGIQLPANVSEVTFAASGSVLVKVPNETGLIEIGQIELSYFSNNHGLNRVGHNLFMETEQSGSAQTATPGEYGTGQLIQGFAEQSNVSMNEEMVNLMLAQRGYQMNARIIQTSDQILETINNLRR
ncbi:flagellar basal-body rod protein FlgG [Pseudoalteromonas sp. SMS1]|uniref:flagellar basal-body rod protein FlgG n=1 Tax=Pseudoalteromonas sp. SMS1 TaxID=2908894 RepID=UPI001F3A0751|nr:flagellar basal-body rod protein FlgG [Pseudoalteromonas sp. SMS1]MCF2860215.1 flagellar basal-body rod protein FlgG [Pseudoalteromonas sp. SMS1]